MKKMIEMEFLKGLFRERDAPTNRTSGSAYSFFIKQVKLSGRSTDVLNLSDSYLSYHLN